MRTHARNRIVPCLLVASVAAAEPLQVIQVPDRPELHLDFAQARENARRFAEQQRAVTPAPRAKLRPRLEELARQLGEPPPVWSRCTFLTAGELFESDPSARTGELAALERFRRLRDELEVELDGTTHALDSERSPLAPLLRQELKLRRAELVPLLDRVTAALESRSEGGARLGEFLRSCVWADGRTALAQVLERLDAWDASRPAPVLGANPGLTYLNSDVSGPRLTAPTGDPIAYLAHGTAGTTLEDTTAGREIVFSAELTARATQLANAKAAADFVRNDVRLDWYHGVMKDSATTFAERRGNSAELAGLLIALLRGQETPARYVTGTIEVSVEMLASLMGWLTVQELSTPGFTLDGSRRNSVLAALTASGIPYEVTGGAVRMAHVWVEAYLPYGDYRGYAGDGPKQWVPIEPSFTGRGKFSFTAGAVDVLAEMGETPQTLTAAYLASPPGIAFMAFVRSRVEAHLAATRPGTTWADVLGRVTQLSEALEFLPGSLPYKVVGTDGEHAFLPGALLHHLRVTASDGAGPLVDTLLPLHQVVSHRVVWTYKPATPVDADLIATAGGLYAAPASAVRLLPVLRVDGQERVVAPRSVGLGATHSWVLELVLPGGAVKRVENSVIAGNLVAVGLSAPRNGYVEPAQFQTGDQDGAAPRKLYAIAAAYANAWTDAEEELAGLLGTCLVRRTPGLVLVENQLTVEESLGVRTRVRWKGLQMDADLRTATALSGSSGRGPAFMRLSGFQGSFLEAKALTDGTGEESVSATAVLQHAAVQGAPVLTINLSNAATLLPRVQAPAVVLREIADAVAMGREVMVPEVELDVRDWTGTAFIVRDVVTEEGGYFISGVVSGGATVVSPQFWSDQALVAALSSPEAPQATTVQSDIARIVYLPSAPGWGQMGGPPVRVRVAVTTLAGQPVAGAKVTFERTPGGTTQPFFVEEVSGGMVDRTSLTVFTSGPDVTAGADVKLDTDVRHGGMLVDCAVATECDKDPSGGYPVVEEFFGLTQVTAKVERPPPPGSPPGTPPDFIRLAVPIFLAAKPGPPNKVLVDPWVAGPQPAGLEILASTRSAVVTDQFNNPLANRRMVWTQGAAAGRFFIPSGDHRPLVLSTSDSSQVATVELHSSSVGLTEVGYITPLAPAPAAVTLTATVTPATGTTSIPVDSSASKAMRWSQPRLRPSVEGTDFDAPIILQAFERNTAGAWAPIRHDRPSVTKYQATMRVTGRRAGVGMSTTEVVKGAGPENLPAVSLDDDDTFAFWPKNLEGVIGQQNAFSIEITETVPTADGTEERFVCCNDQGALLVTARPFEVDTLHFPVGGTVQPVATAASASDFSVGFRLGNFGFQPVYMRIDSSPGLVHVPGGEVLPRHQTQPDLILVRPDTIKEMLFAPRNQAGGDMNVTFHVPVPSSGDPDKTRPLERFIFRHGGRETTPNAASLSILGATPFLEIAGTTPARLTFPVRNPRSQTGTNGQLAPAASDADEDPIREAGSFVIHTNASGRVEVRRLGALVASGELAASTYGVQTVAQTFPSVPGAPSLLNVRNGELVASMGPGGPVPDSVEVTLATTSFGTLSQTRDFETRISDLGALPLGQTMVKGVNLADGHLYKSTTDLTVPGRGVPLEFSRSYTSGGSERSPLGFGWTHNYRVRVSFGGLSGAPATAGQQRWIVSGAAGGAQVFTCTSTTCRPQRGYHGTLTRLAAGWEFRTKGGVKYGFEEMPGQSSPKYRLHTITDAVGANVTTLEYADAEWDGEVARVYDAGDKRFLDFTYARTPRGKLYLNEIRLYRNSNPLGRLPPDEPAELSPSAVPLDVCLRFTPDVNGNLETASRGSCLAGVPLRSETYVYDVNANTDELKSNLKAHTDFNGRTTTYQYMGFTDLLEGEGDYVYFSQAEKKERIREVNEPLGVTTGFKYVLVSPATAATSNIAMETRVSSPRVDEPVPVPDTVYKLEPYGTAGVIERPLARNTPPAVTQQRWNAEHLLEEEIDPRGRVTHFTYDPNGNLIERRILVVTAGMGTPALEPTKDATGADVTESVEKWGYDQTYSQLNCHIDPEGRAERHTIQQGVTIRSVRLATPVPRSAMLNSHPAQDGTSDCGNLASATSSDDIATLQQFFGVNMTGAIPPAGAAVGDLAQRLDGRGKKFRVATYDPYGNPQESYAEVEGTLEIRTDSFYDDRSRLERTTDGFGRHTEYRYDALDRRVLVDRRNSAGDSNGQPVWYEYWPSGQVRFEHYDLTGSPAEQSTPPTGAKMFVRESELDDLNRVSVVRERQTQQGREVELTTRNFYDKNSNLVRKLDRRGVATSTTYDFADRPTEVRVEGSPCSGPLPCATSTFTSIANNGEPGEVGVGGVTATFEYDAVGNKVAQTNAQGQRTELGIDGLYRVVKTVSPRVPGATLPSSGLGGLTPWTSTRQLELTGAVVREEDGNGHATRTSYDAFGRVARVEDAEGRVELREYDKGHNLERQCFTDAPVPANARCTSLQPPPHRMRATSFDGLNRPLDVVETVQQLAGAPHVYTTQTRYDDAAHETATKDARGFITRRKLDALDRVFEEIVDDVAFGALARTPDNVAECPPAECPALQLTTRLGHDGMGNRARIEDALHRVTTEVHDALGRLRSRQLPMSFDESFTFDGEGNVISHTDVRGQTRKTTYDALGRARKRFVAEGGGAVLRRETSYEDAPQNGLSKRIERDANGNESQVLVDGLGRDVKLTDPAREVQRWAYDAVVKREEVDKKGYKTSFVYDAVNRLRFQRELDVGATSATYTQETRYEDAARTVTRFDRTGIETVVVSDGLGRAERTTRQRSSPPPGVAAASPQVELTRYNANSQAVSTLDANEHLTTRVFDGAGRKRFEMVGLDSTGAALPGSPPVTTSLKYDAVGNVVESTKGRVAHDVRTTYDELNRAVRLEDGAGNVTYKAYDGAGTSLA